MKHAVLSPHARLDLRNAARWIALDNPTAARALRISVQKAAQHLAEHTQLGMERPELAHPPFRFFPVSSFPYVLVYNSMRTPPLIVRVLHGARDLPEILADLDQTNPKNLS